MDDTRARDPGTGSIVVGIDGSAGAALATEWAVAQARTEHRRLTLLHCGSLAVLRNTVLLDAQGIDHAELYGELRAADLQLLERAAAAVTAAHPDLAVETVLVETDPRTALVEASQRAHLVVLGSRGRGPLASQLLGSVSRYVAAHAACPVVVCRERPAGAPRSVVVGVDWSAASVRVAEFAFRQASMRGQPLVVMHALWHVDQDLVDRPLGAVDDLDGLGAMLTESVAGLRETYPDVPVTFELRRGLADECLAGATPTGDLVVVGRPPHDLVTRLVDGTTALAVLERSHGVVAVVPTGPEDRARPPAD